MENVSKWDPLDYGAGVTEELLGATIKRQIKNILKSYTGWYDPLSELIQNSLDAVDERKKLAEKGYIPTLWIRINLKDNLLCVTDNGVGFKEAEFRNFMAPNISFKKIGNRGNKGVGATYLGYGFNFLQAGTKNSEYNFVGTIKNGRKWVEDNSGTVVRPTIQKNEPIHEIFNSLDRGSTFTLKFEGDFIRPKDLKWLAATNAKQWDAILRIKTPLGGIYFTKEKPIHVCNLEVIDENGMVSREIIGNCEYVYPHTVFTTCRNIAEIQEIQKKLISEGKDPSKIPDSFYKLNGIYRTWTAEDIIKNQGGLTIALSEKEIETVKALNIWLYGFFCYSTDIWKTYNDEILKLRKGAKILKGGIQLATNNMPQGELTPIYLTKNIGYQNVTHIIIHIDNADPDLGRKGFQPEIHDLSQKISAACVKFLTIWKKLLKADTGAPPDIIASKEIHEWIREQEEHEKRHPLIIKRQDVFLPIKEPSLTSEPLDEQDAIVLFNQLLAGGVIRGIKVMSTSQHEKYDGVIKFNLKKPFENHIFHKEKNPLGIEESRVTQEFTSEPRILEYKYSVDALLEEFENETKIEKQISLIVAWKMGENWKLMYDVIPLLLLENLHHRPFHGATHILKNSNNPGIVFYAIILDELIRYLNDSDGEQQYQKRTYMPE